MSPSSAWTSADEGGHYPGPPGLGARRSYQSPSKRARDVRRANYYEEQREPQYEAKGLDKNKKVWQKKQWTKQGQGQADEEEAQYYQKDSWSKPGGNGNYNYNNKGKR